MGDRASLAVRPHEGILNAMEDRWQEVQAALAEALDIPSARRAQWLERAALPPEVRRRVAELLEASQESDGFLETPPLRVSATAVGASPASFGGSAPERGTAIGPWRIISLLGSGGMGSVYLVERDDGQYVQQAALKLIAAGRMTPRLERRFREERQILARLEHANIARLIDGGVAPDGSPYLVMEYVRGLSLSAWVLAHQPPRRELLQIVRNICDAVQYAHRNLVVHCDLKPGNILVSDDGTPKLLDFGIARIIQDGSDTAATVVQAMTPDYASPEQVRGEPLTTAADIYSLGVILYELVTGRRPYNLSGKTLDEVIRTVCHRSPEPPRTGDADLDAVVLKPLRKEAPERYASAGEFSADIARYLEGRPVQAQPPRYTYVLRKFIGRHKAAVALAAGAVSLLIIAGALIVRESYIAQRRFNEVRRLAHFVIFDMNDAIAKLPGSTPVRKQIVAHALAYLDGITREATGDQSLQVELAQAYLRIGKVSGDPQSSNLGDLPGALASYRKAESLLKPIVDKSPSNVFAARALSETYSLMESVYTTERQWTLGMQAAEAELAIQSRLADREASRDNLQNLAKAHFSKAHALQMQSAAGAVDEYLAATKIYESLLAANPGDSKLQRSAALTHKYIAALVFERGHSAEEGFWHQFRARDLDQARVTANPSDREAKLDLSRDIGQLGTFTWWEKKDAATGLKYLQEALAIRDELAASDPSDISLQGGVAFLEKEIARVLLDEGRPAESQVHAARAVRVAEAVDEREASPFAHARHAEALLYLGKADAALGRTREACHAWLKSRALLEQNPEKEKSTLSDPELLNELRRLISENRCAP